MKFPHIRKRYWIPTLILLLAGAGAGYWHFRSADEEKADAENSRGEESIELDRVFKVHRDDLVIGLLQGGYINASKKHKISLQANYRTKILWLIDENTKVKTGTLLARLETEGLREQIETLEIDLDNLTKELGIALEAQKILVSTNAAELQNAEEKLLDANDTLRKYRRFERTNKRDSLDMAITNAETALEEAEDNYVTIRDTEAETSTDEDADEKKRKELKTAQTKIDKAENTLSQAEDNRKVFRHYDNPSKMSRLSNAFEQAQLSLRKVRISTESKLVQQKRTIDNLRRRIRRRKTLLERYRSYMPMMKLRAPVDGVVIYADPDRRWGNLDVKPGIEIHRGQVIFTIPEMSNLVVDFSLPEQYRSKVKVGDRALVFPDSLPGEKFEGTVSHIDTLPVNLVVWDSSSPKVYKTRVKLHKQSPKLVNGMSAQINIVTKILRGVLFVPVEAVFEENDRFFVYLVQPGGGFKEVDVQIGGSNDNFVQIKKGLSEGDVVCLYRPYQKKEMK